MSVKRRRSNWYIYFIAFGITFAFVVVAIFAFRWYLFPEKAESVGLTSEGTLDDSFKPTSAQNFVMLTMLSENYSEAPGLFGLMVYNAVENTITYIPVPAGISIDKEGRPLSAVYASGGGESVVEAVEDTVGVKCDCFVKLDKSVFTELVSSFGNVEYDVPQTVIISDGAFTETINAGTQFFSAERLFTYIMKADFGEGELYRFNCVGDILSELINQNFRSVDNSLLDMYFGMIYNDADSDISLDDYTAHKAALLNTVEYGNIPADYYVPYGEYAENGAFTISDGSVTSIRQRAGQGE